MRFFGKKSRAKPAPLTPSPPAEGDRPQVLGDQVALPPAVVPSALPPQVPGEEATPPAATVLPRAEGACQEAAPDHFREIQEHERRLITITQQYNEARLALQASLFAQREAVASSIQDARTKRQAILKRQETLSSRLEALQQQGDQKLSAQRDELSAKMDSTTAQLASMKAEQAHDQQELSHLDEQIQATKKATTALLDDLKAIGDQLRQVEDPTEIISMADANRKAVSEMHGKLEQLNQQKVALEATKRKLVETAKDGQRAIGECNETLAADQQAIDRIEQEIQDAQKHRQDEIAAIKAQLDAVFDQLDAQEAILSSAAADKQRIDEEVRLWLGTANRITSLQLGSDVPVVLMVDAFGADQQGVLRHLAVRLEHRGSDLVNLYFGEFDIRIADKIQAWLDQAGLQPTQVNICNPLFQLQNTKTPVKKAIKLPKYKEETWNDDHTVRTVKLEEEAFVLEITYRDTHAQRIAAIAYYTNGKLVKQTSFNRDGIMVANAFYDASEVVTRTEYYRDDGVNILNAYYQEGKLARIELIDGNGLMQKVFHSVAELNQWWLPTHTDDHAALIGSLDDQAYRKLVEAVGLAAIPYISEKTAPEVVVEFAPTMAAKRFVVANHEQQEMLDRQVDADLEMLVLDETFMPVSLATPALADQGESEDVAP